MPKRESSIIIRVNEQEKELLQRLADRKGLTMSCYIRQLILAQVNKK